MKGTKLEELYRRGEICAPEREEYVERALLFLRFLSPAIAVHRLIGRAPEGNQRGGKFSFELAQRV